MKVYHGPGAFLVFLKLWTIKNFIKLLVVLNFFILLKWKRRWNCLMGSQWVGVVFIVQAEADSLD